MKKITILLVLALVLAPVLDVLAGEMEVYLPNGLRITKKVKSIREARYNSIVPQKYDISCGAASLATILKYFYNKDVTEEEIINEMLELGNKEKIMKGGFSLLEIKKYAEDKGYTANGYKVSVDTLEKLKIPVITLLNVKGYAHFVVLKGAERGKVFIADPAFGNKSMEQYEFEKSWNNIIFVLLSSSEKGQSQFTKDETLKATESGRRRFLNISMGSIFAGRNEF